MNGEGHLREDVGVPGNGGYFLKKSPLNRENDDRLWDLGILEYSIFRPHADGAWDTQIS